MIMTSVHVIVQETILRILNSHIYCIYTCHSQTTTMAAIVIFVKVFEWQWHYDPVLDFLYLMASSCFRLYIFFYCSFVVSVLWPFFDPEAPFNGIPLFMAYSAAASPQPSHPASIESDPSKVSSSSSLKVASIHLVVLELQAS